MLSKITVSPSPHISQPHSTRSIMGDVIIALVPAMIAAFIFFKTRALVLVGVCVATCVVSEWLCNLVRKKPNSLDDLSAVVTGIILAFSVPPALPAWAAVIGSAFAVIIGKMVFGGLGANIFNPAMVGRAFLAACFGMLMTTWTVPATLDPAMPKITATGPGAITQATINPNAYMPPWLHLTTGGMLLGAFFIATDPVTAPLSTKGMWIFGIGTGALIMLIRIVGEYPEGVMYAILIMNAVTPLIDRFCKLTPAGGVPNA